MASSTARQHAVLTLPARDVLLIVACVAAHVLYLLVTYFRYGYFSFPLDDAWIYQVYARNLAQSGQWAFVPGVPSTGSTSIVWPLLMAPAYLLHIDALVWTHLLGLVSLIAASLGAARWFEEESLLKSLAVGLAIALEWHLVWAAASGMETGLFTALLIWFWVWLRRHDPGCLDQGVQTGLVLGLWGGVLMLARPEGALAFGIAWLYGLSCPGNLRSRLRWAIVSGLGFTLLLIPFLLLNHSISGTIWPNTFYAKQTEYTSLWTQPYLLRFIDQGRVCFVGAQILLIPGLLAWLWFWVKKRPIEWVAILPWGWALLHWALYAARLPVTYQHGRYAIPVIPLIVTYGMRGLITLARPRARRPLIRLSSLAWMLTVGTLFPLFLGLQGAPAYGRDVSFIEVEMVSTAKWIAENTASDDIIAAHDIGALGYFSSRHLVDLAGLASPDVIVFMNDNEQLVEYVIESGASYLVVFPEWSPTYTHLTSDARFCPVWSAAEEEGYISYSNVGSMTVYEVQTGDGCLTKVLEDTVLHVFALPIWLW
ncbi:MAG: hypothetical protein JXB30_04050 [Anaerolineae bacterium]|nr:hypothetical protein [Anaerolineae bacterium]